ncbi:hypothetical protein [Embleya sp. NPDC059237]|uniref:hypothetical protein n=1 Tax=Embleya sp. NPDC059237 TaxID=3346784 RepID=UPI0036972B23
MFIAVVTTAVALAVVVALLASAAAAKLARIDGATYPQALARAGVTFATVLTASATIAAALAAVTAAR